MGLEPVAASWLDPGQPERWPPHCTRECLVLIADTSLSGAPVARELATAFAARSKPRTIVSDNGVGFPTNALLKFVDDRKFGWHYTAPGKPTRDMP